jgi:hypothetical protein
VLESLHADDGRMLMAHVHMFTVHSAMHFRFSFFHRFRPLLLTQKAEHNGTRAVKEKLEAVQQ